MVTALSASLTVTRSAGPRIFPVFFVFRVTAVDITRNGPTGTVNVTFIDRFARFENMSVYENAEAEVPF